MREWDGRYAPLLGETAWHSVILDPRIGAESERHYDLVRAVWRQFGSSGERPPHILEVACYAHTTGYRLARDLGARVTLFEVSRHSLRRGRELGGRPAEPGAPRLVAGDFHALPFEDAAFDLVFLCSALHHTWDYQRVLRELMRVTAPGGLVFLENEPTERGLCFHRFRCNRPPQFTPFERRLAELDLLRTVAEPYVGSRPEALFGMIENQTIPLAGLFGVLDEACELELLELTPEQCMGGRERAWLKWRGRDAAAVARSWRDDVAEACRAAQAAYTEVDRGLGYGLPTEAEIAALADLAGPALAGLPLDPASAEYRFGLARLFGAPVRLVARKRPVSGQTPVALAADLEAKASRFGERPQRDGIIEAYPDSVRSLLGTVSLWPELQTTAEADCRAAFGAADWTYRRDEAGLVSLVSRGPDPAIRIPRAAGPNLLVLLRIYCLVEADRPYQVEIRCGSRSLFRHAAYLPETVLAAFAVTPETEAELGGDLRLALRPTDSDGPVPRVAVSYAGLFPLAGGG